jgi:hypothetical protein
MDTINKKLTTIKVFLMHKKIVSVFFTLFILFLCLPAQAIKLPTANSTTYTAYYGKVVAISPIEQHIIINDVSIAYGSKSKYSGNLKKSTVNIEHSAQQGSFVKYYIQPQGESKFFLLDLQLVSEAEFNEVKARRYDD